MNAAVLNHARMFAARRRSLIGTGIAWKALAYTLLAPLVAIVIHGLLRVSGHAILADVDIVLFLLTPFGWLCLLVGGGLTLGVLALEQAALLAVLSGGESPGLDTVRAIRFAIANAVQVLRVTLRAVGTTAVVIAPFLAVVALVHAVFLRDHDINYYLAERPVAFYVVIVLDGVTMLAAGSVLLRLFSGWAFALPMVLFEGTPTHRALRASRDRAQGKRRTIVLWIVAWGAAMLLLEALITAVALGLGRLLLPDVDHTGWALTATVGAAIVLWGGVSLGLALLGTTSLAAVQYGLYCAIGDGDRADPPRLDAALAPRRGGMIKLTRLRLVALAGAGIVGATIVGALSLRSVDLAEDVVIVAHRGASSVAPENTLAAVDAALVAGADAIEVDVQVTADGHVVVIHDRDLMRVARVPLDVELATLDEVQDHDVGSWFDPAFANERVPTLDAVLARCAGRASVFIELKTYGAGEQMEERVVEVVETRAMAGDVVILSLDADALARFRRLRPDWTTGLLLSVAAGDLDRLDADLLAINARSATRTLIRDAHKRNTTVYAWTINESEAMHAMISRGVHGIITDRPTEARAVLDARSALTAPERLLQDLGRRLRGTD